MAQINKPTDYFETKLYAGSSSNVTVSGLDFQPDWIWLKNRTNADNHVVCDVVRGGNSNGLGNLYPNLTDAEYLPSSTNDSIETINSDGFVVGGNGNTNGSGENFVSWSWKAGGTGSSNTDGSITSTVSASTVSGFSIVSYTGTGANATVGHGLGAVPKMIIVKDRSAVKNWTVYHIGVGNDKDILLDVTNAENTSTAWNNTTPTSSVFSIGTLGNVNTSSNNYIAYCFAEKKGFSKFGSYTGNGNADGTFVYTGFKPAFTILKRTDSADNWIMQDNKRKNPFNVVDTQLFPDLNNAESSSSAILDYCSNGFKIRKTGGNINASGGSYIYMAFAEQPLVGTNNIPATAR